jgi:ParB family chromosome partitioning protein
MNQVQKRRLGRGLAALIGDDSVDETIMESSQMAPEIKSALRQIPVSDIVANPLNPRKVFAQEELDNLARSIRDKGLLQPLVVRPGKINGTYEIVAGERRWRASQMAQVHDVPVLIRNLDDRETLEIALIENIQRADLNPLEEASAYKQLIDMYDYTQLQLAEGLGKSRSHIANMLRLLTLPKAVLEQIDKGLLTAGHARALVATDNASELAEQIIKLGMSVRQVEDLTRSGPVRKKTPKIEKDNDTRAMEKQIAQAIGLSVDLAHKGDKGGTLTITYKTLEQLDEVCRRLVAER